MLKIKRIRVFIGLTPTEGCKTDIVFLTLDVLTPYPNWAFQPPPEAKIDVEAGYGIEWARKAFPEHVIEVVDASVVLS